MDYKIRKKLYLIVLAKNIARPPWNTSLVSILESPFQFCSQTSGVSYLQYNNASIEKISYIQKLRLYFLLIGEFCLAQLFDLHFP